MDYFLSIDQGTTSSRTILFDQHGNACHQASIETSLTYPNLAWVEQSAEDIWHSTCSALKQTLDYSRASNKEITAIGITNQRETTLLWDKKTGEAIYPAIVWQDRRTSEECTQLLKDKTLTAIIRKKTGLIIDPYFSATKIAWILNNVAAARRLADQNELAFGTIDSFLLWHLTQGRVHATDATNASRTLLYNIHTNQWDDELLTLFNIPKNILPTVYDSAHHYGNTQIDLFDNPIPITGIAGDQQAATLGQACITPGSIKNTYGTGCFLVAHTGSNAIQSKHRLLTTIVSRINGVTQYGLEGSIFVAGAAVQWLRDALQFFKHANDTQAIAQKVDDTGGVYLVPAFTGLGAPYWDPNARGSLLGLTRDTRIEHIVRAALEAVCYQTSDLLQAIQADLNAPFTSLRVDGGMTENQWLLQRISDISQITVERPQCIECSALGAAMLAALGINYFTAVEQVTQWWRPHSQFTAKISLQEQQQLYRGWQKAIASTQLNTP